jgi:hypothetical protein
MSIALRYTMRHRETRRPSYVLPLDSFQEHGQLRPLDLHASTVIPKLEREGPFLQPLVQEPETIPIPNQKLDPILAGVEEGEQIAGEGIISELVPNQGAEAIVSLAEVYGL